MRWLAFALLVAGAGVMLDGCSNDKPDVAPAPALSTPPASPSPTEPIAPELPAAVKVKNQAGAEAAFRYWVMTYTYGFATGDAMPMRSVVMDECDYCKDILGTISQMAFKDLRYVGGSDKVLQLVSVRANDDSSYLLRALVSQGRAVQVDGDGKPQATEPGEPRVSFDALVTWDVDRWRLFKVGVADE